MANPRTSCDDSISSVSTTSLVFERMSERNSEAALLKERVDTTEYADLDDDDPLKEDDDDDVENAGFLGGRRGARLQRRGMDRRLFRIVLICAGLVAAAWFGALALYVVRGAYKHGSTQDHDPAAKSSRGSGKTVTLEQVLGGTWLPNNRRIQWISSPGGEDGLLLLQGSPGKDYLVVEDVRRSARGSRGGGTEHTDMAESRTLMKDAMITYGGETKLPDSVWPSPDLRKVLIATDRKQVFRYSFTATYWILDVETQEVEPLDPLDASARLQMAIWGPKSDTVAFTRGGNLYLRRLDSRPNKKLTQITRDGGPNVMNGIPDWVYEEEVIGNHVDTYWSSDGKFLAFMKYNETGVPHYPVQFFIEPPQGNKEEEDDDDEHMMYPVVKEVPYPKAGTQNPKADYFFYDVDKNDVFEVPVSGSFPDSTRVVTNVVWCGTKVIIKEANRAADLQRLILVDAKARTGVVVRTLNATELDGGWFDTTKPRCIPADPDNGRPDDGYIDFDVSGFGDHLAYHTPLDNPEPVMLTSGEWEVTGQGPMSTDDSPIAVDLANNLVYFSATKESSIQRHVYSVSLNGSSSSSSTLTPFTDTADEAYYSVSFSAAAGYALVNYQGPNVPWYKVVSTPSNPASRPYEHMLEDNKSLREKARKFELPIKRYGTINVDGFDLNYVERLPPHFDDKKKHPVLFYQYSGPKSQTVTKKFEVDFQSAMASLGYIVVSVDGRGTGFIGRKARSAVRGHLGRWEANDQVEAGKIWAAKSYVDPERLAIWGWSFGGYNTLKTLERDGGRTFKYGMAVAPVTDWRYYDSVYTERYMGLPQDNPSGYTETAVHNVTSLGQNVRFIIMHGVADDNVHMQNTLKLLDALDDESITNFDVHVFPDSNHGIYFHNARYIVYHRLQEWLINAFNGEWLKISKPVPKGGVSK